MENVAVELKKEIDIFERGRYQVDLDTTGGEAGYGLEVNKTGWRRAELAELRAGRGDGPAWGTASGAGTGSCPSALAMEMGVCAYIVLSGV